MATGAMADPHTATVRDIKYQIMAMFPNINRRVLAYFTPHLRNLHTVIPEIECQRCACTYTLAVATDAG
jgi:hypothetical protein